MHVIKKTLLLSFLLFSQLGSAQNLKAVYSANQLFERISSKDTLYVLNFWATWCKPCMEELQAIDSVGQKLNGKEKLIFVNLDFVEKQTKVNQVLANKGIQSQCILLDEVNGNAYIEKIHKDWSGEIPATVLFYGEKKTLLSQKLTQDKLQKALLLFKSGN